ncbi:MAG: ABC transporter substrate-binding protein, partial [Candidatus Saccharimonadales bacterium]
YNPAYAQSSFNLAAAKSLLSGDGWMPGSGGIRVKANQPLTFTLTAQNTAENQLVTKQLAQQWSELGVKLDIQLLGATDFQNTLNDHSYDAVLSGISIGVDPDVFVYWDSSQADIRSANRLNFSEYKNPTTDEALEAGRTRLDSQLRVIKYAPFLQAWQQDNPALGLYQPRLLYLTNGSVGGLDDPTLNSATNRFYNVNNWEIRETRVTR